MKVKDYLNKHEFIVIVGDGWVLNVQNANKEFKTTFKDILEKDVKRTLETKVGLLIYV